MILGGRDELSPQGKYPYIITTEFKEEMYHVRTFQVA